jgi:CBS domain-containing protein
MGYKYIFGPVVSRRLGISLGIDPIKRKHCTLDCIYCQVARTDMHSIKREVDVKAELIIDEIKDFIKKGMICARLNDSIKDITIKMKLHDISQLPVIDDHNLHSLLHHNKPQLYHHDHLFSMLLIQYPLLRMNYH